MTEDKTRTAQTILGGSHLKPSQLRDLIEPDMFRQWQASHIYIKNKFKDQNSDIAREARAAANRRQQALLGSLSNGPEATRDYLCDQLLNGDSDALTQFPKMAGPITPGAMKDLPADDEERIHGELKAQGLVPAVAAESSFWALCHTRWIGETIFGPDVADVFTAGGPRGTGPEERTRNFLRRTGGLQGVRGYTSVITDCPISSAWWRVSLAREIHETISGEPGPSPSFEDIHDILRIKSVWTALIDLSVHRVTAINAPRARAAVVAAAAEHSLGDQSHIGKPQIQDAIQSVGALAYRSSLYTAAWDMLVAAARNGLGTRQRSRGSGVTRRREREGR